MSSFSSLNKALSTKWLIAFFVICFLCTSLYKLPVSVLNNGLRSYGVEAREVSGSFWDARFKYVVVANQFWQVLDIKPHKSSLFLGQIEADFNAVNEESRLSGVIRDAEGGALILTSIRGVTQLNIRQNGKTYPSTMNITSDHLELSDDGSCINGNFNIKTNFLNVFLSKMNLDMPQLEGVGDCIDGRILTSLRASENGIDVIINGEFSKTAQKGNITISLPEEIENNQTFVNELMANGFSKNASVWQATMELEL